MAALLHQREAGGKPRRSLVANTTVAVDGPHRLGYAPPPVAALSQGGCRFLQIRFP
jgi:hypothetical protein